MGLLGNIDARKNSADPMTHFRTDMAPFWLLLEHARKKGSAYANENCEWIQ